MPVTVVHVLQDQHMDAHTVGWLKCTNIIACYYLLASAHFEQIHIPCTTPASWVAQWVLRTWTAAYLNVTRPVPALGAVHINLRLLLSFPLTWVIPYRIAITKSRWKYYALLTPAQFTHCVLNHPYIDSTTAESNCIFCKWLTLASSQVSLLSIPLMKAPTRALASFKLTTNTPLNSVPVIPENVTEYWSIKRTQCL